MEDEKMVRCKGVVTKFMDQKGFGFIQPDEGGDDLFVHQTAIKSEGYRTLREGQEVEFTILLEGDKTKAIDVTAPGGGPVDWPPRRGNGGSNARGGGYGLSDRRDDGNGYGYRGGGGGECFNCGEFGHMARDCNAGSGSVTGGGGPGGGGGGCYTCGGYGHMARDCPSGGRTRGGGGGGYGGSGTCYNCGEPGHIARDCMRGGSGGGYSRGGDGGYGGRFSGGNSGGGGGKCYNCGGFGHFARDCRDVPRE